MRHPVIEALTTERKQSWQLRLADTITRFAGSMAFVWIHVGIFALWCSTGLFGRDQFPFNFLTMTVSLEAIFLATFVMIGQNRLAAFSAAKAEHDYQHQEVELADNTKLTAAIHQLTQDIHAKVMLEIATPVEPPGAAVVAAVVEPQPTPRKRRTPKRTP